MIGRRFSHFHVVSALGSGATGTVYRAEDTLLGRPVALKFPHPHLLQDESARARLLREARAASALDHPHIVVLYDVGEVEGQIYLAMQCVEGRSLRQRLALGPVALEETLSVGRAVADALAHAHARGVVHRDVKPENVLLDAEGRVKVADFGLARVAGEPGLTLTSGFFGTPAYAAPEVVRGEPAEARSDLYALGALLHELLSGAPAFGGGSAEAVLYQTLHAEPPALPASTPAALGELVRSLLAKAPDQRPPSAVVVAETLAALAGGTAPAPAAAAQPPTAAPKRASPPRSIAVFPFENLTGAGDDDYFCAGMTEDLLTEILRIPDLKVASRTMVEGLRGRGLDARKAARALGVGTVLEGGVRRSGDRVRVNTRLVQAETGFQIWAERYDRRLEDVFEVQADVSRQIARALSIVLTPEDDESHLGRRTRRPRAYDLRLQALEHARRYEEADMRHAIQRFEEALAEDPDYALARADLAECQVQMVCKEWDLDTVWLDRAEREATQAIERAPSLPEAHRALGHLWMHRGQPERARRFFAAAVELDPRFADGLLKLGNSHLFLGDLTRAEVYTRRAYAVDPQDVRIVESLGNVLLRQGRFAEARDYAARALALNPRRATRIAILEDLLLSYAWEGRMEELERQSEAIREELGESDPHAQAYRALAAALWGRADEARRLLEATPTPTIGDTDLLVARARVYVLLEDREGALDALQRARQRGLVDVAEVAHDPYLSRLNDDPRFSSITAPLPAAVPASS